MVVGVGGLRQVSAGGVHDALGLAGGARGVEQEQRLLGVEGLRGMVRRRLLDGVVPPQVAALGPVHVDSGSPNHQNVSHRGLVGDRLVDGILQRHRLSSPVLPVGGDHQLGLSVLHRALNADAENPPKTTGVHDAQPSTGEHRDDRLGNHRHVDGHPVARDQTELRQRVGRPAHLVRVARR